MHSEDNLTIKCIAYKGTQRNSSDQRSLRKKKEQEHPTVALESKKNIESVFVITRETLPGIELLKRRIMQKKNLQSDDDTEIEEELAEDSKKEPPVQKRKPVVAMRTLSHIAK